MCSPADREQTHQDVRTAQLLGSTRGSRVAFGGSPATPPYFVTNGGGAILSTQLTSRFLASPLSRNSIAIRSIQPGSVMPSTPWPASGTMMCLLFGKCLATSLPYFWRRDGVDVAGKNQHWRI